MKAIKEFKERYEKFMEEDVDLALEYALDSFKTIGNADILVYIGEALMSNEDFEGANEAIDNALSENCEDKLLAYSLKGEALFYLDKYKESRDSFNEVIKQDVNSFFATVYLVDIDIAEGKYLDGIIKIDTILNSKSLNSEDTAFMETKKGWIMFKYLEKQEEAYNLFKGSILKDENCGTAYVGLGSYYLYKKNYEKSINNYEKALDLGEGSSIVYEGLEKARRKRG